MSLEYTTIKWSALVPKHPFRVVVEPQEIKLRAWPDTDDIDPAHVRLRNAVASRFMVHEAVEAYDFKPTWWAESIGNHVQSTTLLIEVTDPPEIKGCYLAYIERKVSIEFINPIDDPRKAKP